MKLKEKAEAGFKQVVSRMPLSVVQQRRLWARALVARDAILQIHERLHALSHRLSAVEEALEIESPPQEPDDELPESKEAWKARENKVIRGIQRSVERSVRKASGLKE